MKLNFQTRTAGQSWFIQVLSQDLAEKLQDKVFVKTCQHSNGIKRFFQRNGTDRYMILGNTIWVLIAKFLLSRALTFDKVHQENFTTGGGCKLMCSLSSCFSSKMYSPWSPDH